MGGGHGESTTYKGFTVHHPKRWHAVTGKGLCAIMWFWVLYRAKQDGPVVLGWRHPWEGHDDHSHSHGHKHEHELLSLMWQPMRNDNPHTTNIRTDAAKVIYQQ